MCSYHYAHLHRKFVTANGIYLVSLGIIFQGTPSQSWRLLVQMLTAQGNAKFVAHYVITYTNVMTCAMII